uniref:Oxoglutarate/iron-dependent dioxygenase n=1 Tax=Tanacetum cinerariifolium TaxID=118510 RepID=A0A6L2P1Z3_TANCI|nr:oxoglutarate/iron-dependent dioxygenase [Tanacetum cinerariifolium]
MEDQRLPADASPTALSPDYVVDYDLEKDEKYPKEDPADYPADRGDNVDDESSNDDDDDDKSYADKRLNPLEFKVVDMVLLKVPPWKGVVRFGKHEKLSPRYIGSFKILARVGPIAYTLELPEELKGIHSTFHVSSLKKCLAKDDVLVSIDEIQLDDKLHMIEEPVEVMDREVKRLK